VKAGGAGRFDVLRRVRGIPWRLSGRWLVGAVGIFALEVFIALRVHDRWVRPYGGDALVVALVHAAVRSVVAWPWRWVLAGTLLFAFTVEGLQALHLVRFLHLQSSRFWSIVLGTHADVSDLASYALGGLGVALFEEMTARRAMTGRRARPR